MSITKRKPIEPRRSARRTPSDLRDPAGIFFRLPFPPQSEQPDFATQLSSLVSLSQSVTSFKAAKAAALEVNAAINSASHLLLSGSIGGPSQYPGSSFIDIHGADSDGSFSPSTLESMASSGDFLVRKGASRKKKCASCNAKKTPYWRDGWDSNILLCNACGIRYQKYKKYCVQCQSTARKDEKGRLHCPVCQDKL